MRTQSSGPIEYTSMLIGLRSVWPLVLVVYLLAWLSTRVAAQAGDLETNAPMRRTEPGESLAH